APLLRGELLGLALGRAELVGEPGSLGAGALADLAFYRDGAAHVVALDPHVEARVVLGHEARREAPALARADRELVAALTGLVVAGVDAHLGALARAGHPPVDPDRLLGPELVLVDADARPVCRARGRGGRAEREGKCREEPTEQGRAAAEPPRGRGHGQYSG